MIIFHHTQDLQDFASKHAEKWQTSGFVPTMGALHEGHISLIDAAKMNSDLTIASIFVNPSQFNDPADFEKYPKTIDHDIRLLEEAGCDILFLPNLAEIYPDGPRNQKPYPLGKLEELLEGHYRPGHFQGVCQVVHILLNITKPSTMFMGAKDFQQCMVVRRLIELEKLSVKLHICPTLRENDGLAMSSRNMRLSERARSKSTSIYNELLLIKNDLGTMSITELEARAIKNLLHSGFDKVDYVSIAKPGTLEPIGHWEPGMHAVTLIAAFIEGVRLIDNLAIPS